MADNINAVPMMKVIIMSIVGFRAILTDLRDERIDNSLTFPFIALSFILIAVVGKGFIYALGMTIFSFMVSFILYIAGVIRGGDSKFLMASSILCGFPSSLYLFLNSFFIALLTALMGRFEEGDVKDFIISSICLKSKESISFSPCIVAGFYSTICGTLYG